MNDENKQFMDKVLAAHGLTDKPVLHDGVWVYPSEFRSVNNGDIYSNVGGDLSVWCCGNSKWPHIIFTPCTLPPSPTHERVAELEKQGWKVNDVPDLESVPFISHDMSEIIPEGDDGRYFNKYHGLRYGLTKIKVEPVVEYWRQADGAILATIDRDCIPETKHLVKLGMSCERATKEDYEAARVKHAVAEPEKTCGNCGSEIGCRYRHLHIACPTWIPKPEQMKEISPLGTGYSTRDVLEWSIEITKAVNQLSASRWPNGGGKCAG